MKKKEYKKQQKVSDFGVFVISVVYLFVFPALFYFSFIRRNLIFPYHLLESWFPLLFSNFDKNNEIKPHTIFKLVFFVKSNDATTF